MNSKKTLLTLVGIANIFIAILHLGIIFGGAAAYRWFGAGETMALLDEQGSPIPAVITFALVLVFVVFALYAFSGAGIIRKLPFVRLVLACTAAIYIFRGLAIFVDIYFVFSQPEYPFRSLVFSSVSLAIGLANLFGLKKVSGVEVT